MTQVAAKLGMLLTPTCFVNLPCCLRLDRCREGPPHTCRLGIRPVGCVSLMSESMAPSGPVGIPGGILSLLGTPPDKAPLSSSGISSMCSGLGFKAFLLQLALLGPSPITQYFNCPRTTGQSAGVSQTCLGWGTSPQRMPSLCWLLPVIWPENRVTFIG